jgi:uncharacterized membrane protein (DUF2068 family)
MIREKELEMARAKSSAIGIYIISAFKIFKGLLLLAAGIGALKLLHKDSAQVAQHWINVFRVDPDNRYIHRLLVKLHLMNDRKLKELSIGTFFYSGLLLTEGIGLAFRKRWAEYFAIIVTGSFLPLEIYEIHRHATLPRVIVLLINIGVVLYLIIQVRRK